ncbi:hypothetical protein, variant, partial [Phytophthora nicotianae P1569]
MASNQPCAARCGLPHQPALIWTVCLTLEWKSGEKEGRKTQLVRRRRARQPMETVPGALTVRQENLIPPRCANLQRFIRRRRRLWCGCNTFGPSPTTLRLSLRRAGRYEPTGRYRSRGHHSCICSPASTPPASTVIFALYNSAQWPKKHAVGASLSMGTMSTTWGYI